MNHPGLATGLFASELPEYRQTIDLKEVFLEVNARKNPVTVRRLEQSKLLISEVTLGQ